MSRQTTASASVSTPSASETEPRSVHQFDQVAHDAAFSVLVDPLSQTVHGLHALLLHGMEGHQAHGECGWWSRTWLSLARAFRAPRPDALPGRNSPLGLIVSRLCIAVVVVEGGALAAVGCGELGCNDPDF